MDENKSSERPIITPLDKKQKGAVLDNLDKRDATFFTWEMLQDWLKRFGPNAKVSEVQQALKKQDPPKKQ